MITLEDFNRAQNVNYGVTERNTATIARINALIPPVTIEEMRAWRTDKDHCHLLVEFYSCAKRARKDKPAEPKTEPKTETKTEVKRDMATEATKATEAQETRDNAVDMNGLMSFIQSISNIRAMDEETVRTVVQDELTKRPKARPDHFIVETPTEAREIKGVAHEIFKDVLEAVNRNINVYIYGPAGTGKNILAQQIAEALGLNFYYTNKITTEFDLTGYNDANGNYHETEFYKAFKYGGLFMFDEIDASDENAVTKFNNALANGVTQGFPFPHETIKAHENFRVIAAGNTLGKGADNVYTGRNVLDGASLNRFLKIKMDYSKKIELVNANDDENLVKFAHAFRAAAATAGIDVIFSYRDIKRIAELKDVFGLGKTLKYTILADFTADDISAIKYAKQLIELKDAGNEYAMAVC